MEKGIGAGVPAHTAPVAMALGPAAILGSPRHVDYVGDQQLHQVILEVLAGLLGAEARDQGQLLRPTDQDGNCVHTAVTIPSFTGAHTCTRARVPEPSLSLLLLRMAGGREGSPAGQAGKDRTQQLFRTACPLSWEQGRGHIFSVETKDDLGGK